MELNSIYTIYDKFPSELINNVETLQIESDIGDGVITALNRLNFIQKIFDYEMKNLKKMRLYIDIIDWDYIELTSRLENIEELSIKSDCDLKLDWNLNNIKKFDLNVRKFIVKYEKIKKSLKNINSEVINKIEIEINTVDELIEFIEFMYGKFKKLHHCIYFNSDIHELLSQIWKINRLSELNNDVSIELKFDEFFGKEYISKFECEYYNCKNRVKQIIVYSKDNINKFSVYKYASI